MKEHLPYVAGFKEDLKRELRNPAFASEFLNACLEENDKDLFLNALRDVLEAQGGMTKIAKAAKINRVSLYKMLHAKGNPGFENILRILKVIGIRFYVSPKKERRPKAA